jgi:hypothetical protein
MTGNIHPTAAQRVHIKKHAVDDPEARTAFGSNSLMMTHTTAPGE